MVLRCVVIVVEPGLPPGERIRLYRRRAGLTQEQCAQLKGCTVSAWRKWESGERQVAAFSDWIEIARILRVRDLYTLPGLPVGELPDAAGKIVRLDPAGDIPDPHGQTESAYLECAERIRQAVDERLVPA